MFAIGQRRVDPADDVFGDLGETVIGEELRGMDVIAQQLGVVVGHLLEVRNDPVLIDRVAMEAAGDLVVDAAARHLREGGARDVGGALFAAARVPVEQNFDDRGMRKLRCASRSRRS